MSLNDVVRWLSCLPFFVHCDEKQVAPGDVIVGVNGKSTAGLRLRAVLELLGTEQRPLTIHFGKRILE